MSWPVSLSEDANTLRAIAPLCPAGQEAESRAVQGIDPEDNSDTTDGIPALLKLNRRLCSSDREPQIVNTLIHSHRWSTFSSLKDNIPVRGIQPPLSKASLKHMLAISFIKMTLLCCAVSAEEHLRRWQFANFFPEVLVLTILPFCALIPKDKTLHCHIHCQRHAHA